MRRHIRKIKTVVVLWRLLKGIARATQYYVLRLIGSTTYPILGCRVPLRDYYDRTRDFFRQTKDGVYIHLQSSAAAPPSRISPMPELFAAVLPKARLLHDYGVIISPDHKLLADVSWEGLELASKPIDHPVMYEVRLPPVQYIAGKVAIVSSLLPDNYYHWMFDILPRFQILQKAGLSPDYYIVNTTTQFQKESLQALGIPSHQILNPRRGTHMQADELIVPSLLGPPFRLTPQQSACEYLRSSFLQKSGGRKRDRALYISRTDARDRHVINEAEICEEVANYGFEVVSLANMPFLQQVEMFAEARVIVGPHGAGFANAVFCEPGSALIELIPRESRNTPACFARLAGFIGLEYYSILGIDDDLLKTDAVGEDFAVDKAAVRRLLRRVHSA